MAAALEKLPREDRTKKHHPPARHSRRPGVAHRDRHRSSNHRCAGFPLERARKKISCSGAVTLFSFSCINIVRSSTGSPASSRVSQMFVGLSTPISIRSAMAMTCLFTAPEAHIVVSIGEPKTPFYLGHTPGRDHPPCHSSASRADRYLAGSSYRDAPPPVGSVPRSPLRISHPGTVRAPGSAPPPALPHENHVCDDAA